MLLLLAKPSQLGHKPAFEFRRAVKLATREGKRPMAVPKRKTTPSKRGMRRAHDRLKSNTFIEDADSGELRRPHHIDLKTGMYRGKQVLEPQDD